MQKVFIIISIAIISGLFIISCSNTFLPDVVISKQPTSEEFFVDSAKGLVVFRTSEAEDIEIKAFDEAQNKEILCISPINYRIFLNETDSRNGFNPNSKIKAIITGWRSDNKPGVWIVKHDNSVISPKYEQNGKRSSLLVGHIESEEEILGLEYDAYLGWSYFPTILSDDGFVIGGYAFNKEGFSSRYINIEQEEKAAVYWNLFTDESGDCFVSRAKVVGVYPGTDSEDKTFRYWIVRILSRFKLILLNYLENYIIDPEKIISTDSSLYEMYGSDIDGNNVIALFDKRDVYSIKDQIINEDNQSPYSIIGPVSPQQVMQPSGSETVFNLLVDQDEGVNDPDGDAVIFNFEIVSMTYGVPDDVVIELDSSTGEFKITHNQILSGQFVTIRFWTEDPSGAISEPYTIDFYFQSS